MDMTDKELKRLISYHEAGLRDYGQFMSPAAVVLEQQTMRALADLQARRLQDANPKANIPQT